MPFGSYTAQYYVVKADLTSYYDTISHHELREELVLYSSAVDTIDTLIGALGALMGTNRGVPQFTAFSDLLSEVFGDLIVRSVKRQQVDLFRYADDFRIISSSYQEALHHLEILDRSACAYATLLNERKTGIVGLHKYNVDLFWLC